MVIKQIISQHLHQIFGEDATLYLEVDKYGTKYAILDSITTVDVKATLVDLKTGKTIWFGAERIEEGTTNNNSNLVVALIGSAIIQVMNSATDAHNWL